MSRRVKRHNNKQVNKRKKHRPIEYKVPIPRSTHIVPDKTIVDLVFRSEFRMSGAASVAKRFITNGLFDPDPTLGGTSPQGFVTWNYFYSFNRVLSFKVDAQCSNIEVYPVTMNFCHLNTDPGTSPTSYPQYAQQAYGFFKQIGPATGKSDLRYVKILTPRHVVGDQMTRTSERYVGSASANPADLTYWGVSVQDNIGSLSNGVSIVLTITYRAEFFDRRNLVEFLEKETVKPEEKKPPPMMRVLNKIIT